MTSPWYETVFAQAPLTQGDLIEACPLVEWDAVAVQGAEPLQGALRGVEASVIVMTQACDLDHGKVQNVLLCPQDSLSSYKGEWERDQRAKEQMPTDNNWKKHCKNIREGFVWNLALLDEVPGGEVVVVDFHEVYTVPRVFLDSFLVRQSRPRHRLLSPYREHLSQAFARFFMRVGLPTPVRETW